MNWHDSRTIHELGERIDLTANVEMNVDEPIDGTPVCNSVRVRGWAFSVSAPVKSVTILLDAVDLGQVEHGIDRPDVAEVFPHSYARAAGFEGVVGISHATVGQHALTIWVTDEQNHTREITRSIDIFSPASVEPINSKIKSFVDQPLQGERCGESIRVSGWTFSETDPIVRVEALVDGEVIGDLPHGMPRTDVEAAYHHPRALRSGFDGTVDVSSSTVGLHALTVRSVDAAGHALNTDPVSIVKVHAYSLPAFPDGHYYSPVVNRRDVEEREQHVWPNTPRLLNLHLNAEGQRAFLTGEFPRYLDGFDYPEDASHDPRPMFYRNNPMFGPMDSRALFVMLRKLHPHRMIEVGSGFSSLLAADVNQRFLEGNMEFTCIEPYPPPYLTGSIPGISRLLKRKMEDVEVAEFAALQAGDILFIDSSHVSKTGSDVNYMIFDVIPRLSPGVFIHFHDIFLPNDYPREWVLGEGRSWNEQYLVRAMLMYTDAFQVVFGSAFVSHYFPKDVEALLGPECVGGGSLWLKVRQPSGTESPCDAHV